VTATTTTLTLTTHKTTEAATSSKGRGKRAPWRPGSPLPRPLLGCAMVAVVSMFENKGPHKTF
jgi:hypothetical protein